MLTIRANGIHGDQVVFEASYVVRGDSTEPASAGRLECYDAAHAMVREIHFGNVYVMNDHGKTVACYELGGFK